MANVLTDAIDRIDQDLGEATSLLNATVSKLAELETNYGIVKVNLNDFFLCSMGAIICCEFELIGFKEVCLCAGTWADKHSFALFFRARNK